MSLKNIFDKMDLSKKFPGYFNKPLIRFGMFIYFVLLMFAIWSHGSLNVAYFSCDSESPVPCVNPFYESGAKICTKSNICDYEILQPGETVGMTPSAFVENVNNLGILIIAITFIINHIMYRSKKRNGKSNN